MPSVIQTEKKLVVKKYFVYVLRFSFSLSLSLSLSLPLLSFSLYLLLFFFSSQWRINAYARAKLGRSFPANFFAPVSLFRCCRRRRCCYCCRSAQARVCDIVRGENLFFLLMCFSLFLSLLWLTRRYNLLSSSSSFSLPVLDDIATIRGRRRRRRETARLGTVRAPPLFYTPCGLWPRPASENRW